MMKSMRALILAGGKGTRLRPLTREIPKELLPVRGKPIISWAVEQLTNVGVDDIGIAISPEKEEDFHWWRRRWGQSNPIHFFVEPEPLGTFGPLILAKDFLSDGDPFFVINGDILSGVDLYKMAHAHAAYGGEATLSLVEHAEPQNYGVAVMDGDLISEFREKPRNPPTNLINDGRYLFEPTLFDRYNGDVPAFSMLEKELFPVLAEEGKLHGFTWKGQWHDCGTPERYNDAMDSWDPS